MLGLSEDTAGLGANVGLMAVRRIKGKDCELMMKVDRLEDEEAS